MKHAALLLPLILLALKTGSVLDYRFAVNETLYLPPHGATSYTVTGVLEFRIVRVNSTAVEAQALLKNVHVNVARAPGNNSMLAQQIESEIKVLNSMLSNRTVVLGGVECMFTPILRLIGGVEIAYYCDPNFLLNKLPSKLKELTKQGLRVDVKSFKKGDDIVLKIKAFGEKSINTSDINATHTRIEVKLSIDAIYSATGLLRHARLYYRIGSAMGFTESKTIVELEPIDTSAAGRTEGGLAFPPQLIVYAALAVITVAIVAAVLAASRR